MEDPFAKYADPFSAYADKPKSPSVVTTPKGSQETRQDSNVIGVDHEAILRKIADLASKYLPASMAPAAAALGTAAVDVPLSVVEALSSPESIASMGAGGPKPVPLLRTERPQNSIISGLKSLGGELRNAPGAGVTGKVTGRILQSLPETKTFNDLPLAEQMDHLPTSSPAVGGSRTGAVPPSSQTAANDVPLYKQQQMMEASPGASVPLGTGGRAQMPPHVLPPPTSPAPPPRLVGKAPTLEEALTDALAEAGKPTDPRITSMAPEVQTAGEGPLSQSGKFGKSGNLGKPGGYSSGRPSLTEAQQNDLLQRVAEKNAPPKPPSASELMRSTNKPEEWHSGAEPGSLEAKRAGQQHRMESDLDSEYRIRSGAGVPQPNQALFDELMRQLRMRSNGD